jgi:hypothetical protein
MASDGYIELRVPEIGTAGSLTNPQAGALSNLGIPNPHSFSFEQASIILSARDYAEHALDLLEQQGSEIDRTSLLATVAIVASDEQCRDRAVSWSRRRYRTGQASFDEKDIEVLRRIFDLMQQPERVIKSL